MNWWMIGFFAWIALSIPVSLIVGRILAGASTPEPEPTLLDRAWAELERFAATGDEDYYWAACDLEDASKSAVYDQEEEAHDADR